MRMIMGAVRLFLRSARFKAGLLGEAAKSHVTGTRTLRTSFPEEPTWDIPQDQHGLPRCGPTDLGRLLAMILAQAESDGATRVQFRFGTGQMIYTLGETDYDMVPPPQPVYCDLVRLLARITRVRPENPGVIPVRFADADLRFAVALLETDKDQFLEIRGFSGKPSESQAPT